MGAAKKGANNLGIWAGVLLLCGFAVLLFGMGYFGGFRVVKVPDIILLVYTLGGGVLLILISRIPPAPVRGLPIFGIGLAGVLIPLALKYALDPGYFGEFASQGQGPGKIIQVILVTGGIMLLLGGARVVRIAGAGHSAAIFVKTLGGVLLAVGLVVPFQGTGSIIIEAFRFKAGAQGFGAEATLWFLAVLLLAFGAIIGIAGYNIIPAASISYVSVLAGFNIPLLIFFLNAVRAMRSPQGASGQVLVQFLMMACYVYPIIYALAGGVADLTGPAVSIEEVYMQ